MTKKILFPIIIFISLFLAISGCTNEPAPIKEDICKDKQNEESKAVCYLFEATIKQDSTLCDNLSGDTIKMICKENVQSVKDGLLECGDDYSCYSQKGDWMAVAKKDETICDNSWNRMDNIAELDKEIGRADCYTKVAQAKHDVSICNKIKFISDNIPSVLTTQCIGMVEKMTD